MNNTLFDQATVRYKNKDYRGALRTYSACLQDNSVPFTLGEVGLIYHRIGNCLVKLQNYNEAIQAYKQAIADPAYDAKGALQNNIGMTYASLRNYSAAAEHFQLALDDQNYDAPYKAYMGLGNAELKQGHTAEAGVAFREAALDESNPDPAKALLNLGICFMALDRPDDAILSYNSALQFDMTSETRNRINASKGQAFVAAGKMAEAVEAFGLATADATYVLSDSASVDYQHALSEIAREQAIAEAVAQSDTSGLDILSDGTPTTSQPPISSEQNPFYYADELEETGAYPGYVDAYDRTSSSFFETTDDELEALSKSLAKKDRRNRNVGLKILVVVIVLLIVTLALGVVAYMRGIGWPTQQAVAEQLFENPENSAHEVFASGLSEDSINTMLAPVIQDPDVRIDGINATATDSVVYASAATGKGGTVTYKITMVRDLIGWKISSIELYFPSLN